MESELVFNTMEVLETNPISDLVTEATIKVCYVSEQANRNRTVITKEVGKEIAATLPGAPVVGFFDKSAQDFVEHSRKITIEGGELRIEDLTKPYGFVSPCDSPWYQDFIEDGVNRTYLMCKAYLWTKQYAEAASALDKGQSMELADNTMSGYYEGDVFVFTHATLDRLCILGDKYEPCFEGARIYTTYAKHYNDFAEEVENIIGRRYFVHNGRLVPNMEKNTLKYALELGFDLHEAIWNQMVNRGLDGYHIEGIFAESGSGIFVILQNNTTLEYVRLTVIIDANDSVTLGSEVQAVSMTWKDKAPVDQTKVSPLQSNPTVRAASSSNADTQLIFAKKDAEIASLTAKIAELENQITDFKKKKEDEDDKTDDESEDKKTDDKSDDKTDDKSDDKKTDDKDEDEDKKKKDKFTLRISELEGQIAILQEQVSDYAKKEAVAQLVAKQEMVKSYAHLLTAEEMKPVTDKLNEYSLEQVEAKLAITYTHKAQSNVTPTMFQLNVNTHTDDSDSIPSFMLKAMEYDKHNNY